MKKLFVVGFLINSSAFAGNGHSTGLMHDPCREDQIQRRRQMENIFRQNQEDLRRQGIEQLERERQARIRKEAEDRERAEQAERERIARERQAAIDEQNRINSELQRQVEAAEQLRQDRERQRREGSLNPSTLSITEMVDVFHHTADAQVKESWALMILILDANHNEALNFLRNVRGWTEEQIAGLNL